MMELTPGELAHHEQNTAELDRRTAEVLQVIREIRKTETDETKITDSVMYTMLATFLDIEDQESRLLAAVGSLSRTLVLLSRTDMFLTEEEPI